jgi:hypothetical protein
MNDLTGLIPVARVWTRCGYLYYRTLHSLGFQISIDSLLIIKSSCDHKFYHKKQGTKNYSTTEDMQKLAFPIDLFEAQLKDASVRDKTLYKDKVLDSRLGVELKDCTCTSIRWTACNT